jgi:hypothetical protein
MVAVTAALRAQALKTCSLSATNGVVAIKPGSRVPGVICVASHDVARMKSGQGLVGGHARSGVAGW